MQEIYLDNNATTPLSDEVVEAMDPFYAENFGNPSSLHKKGVEAERAVTDARHKLAGILGVSESEIIFTSGATEAVNTAMKGVAERNSRAGKHIVTTLVEHDSVLSSCQALEESGFRVTYLPTDRYGQVDEKLVSEAVREDTVLVSVMHVNNELGTVNRVNDIARAVKEKNPKTVFVSDGVQAFGKMPVSLEYVDAYAISAHKLHGPKGVGALVLKRGIKINPLIVGGGQEFNFRSGTQNVAGIVGLSKATERAYSNLDENRKYITELRDTFLRAIKKIDEVVINTPEEALETTLNIAFIGVSAETLLHALEEDGVFISTASACSANKDIKSHVLEHVTRRVDVQSSSVRFSFSRFNTEEEIERVTEILEKKVGELRN